MLRCGRSCAASQHGGVAGPTTRGRPVPAGRRQGSRVRELRLEPPRIPAVSMARFMQRPRVSRRVWFASAALLYSAAW